MVIMKYTGQTDAKRVNDCKKVLEPIANWLSELHLGAVNFAVTETDRASITRIDLQKEERQ